MGGKLPQPRKFLSGDALIALLRAQWGQLPDQRRSPKFSLVDTLLSAFAMFLLKEPSLLAFDQRRHEENLQSLFGLEDVPCDSQMRAILDPVDPQSLRPAYQAIFRQLQRGKVLERYVYLNGCYLLALDGTQYFCSSKIHCKNCLIKRQHNGQVTYAHQMLGAALVHPEQRAVIPLCPEPIIKQDGATKNDCERNAARRFLQRFRQDHPHLQVIVIEDALSGNGPHLQDLLDARCHFILGVKEGDHSKLFETLDERMAQNDCRSYVQVDAATGCQHLFLVYDQVPLNDSHPDLLVQVVEYWEQPTKEADPVRHFAWITDLAVRRGQVMPVMRGGRCRWKIENETFNTLKNQGYHYEHNYGHGEQNLSVVLALLMMLAFLVDQVQQCCCKLFQQVEAKWRTHRLLRDRMRAVFFAFRLQSLQELWETLLGELKRQPPVFNTS
jgi:hypothetical protein